MKALARYRSWSKRRRMAVAAGAALVVLVLAGWLTIVLVYPLEWAAWRSERELRAAGVVSETWGKDRARVWVRTESCGPENRERCRCVLLLHGAGDQPMTWKKVLMAPKSALPEHFEFVAPELSDQVSPRATAQLLLDQYSARCAHWSVLGNSRGGWIATWMGLLAPERITRLALFAPVGLKNSVSETVRGLLRNPTVANLKEFQARAYAKARPIPDAIWSLLSKRAFDQIAKVGAPAEVDPSEYLDDRLAQLKTPVIVWAGKADRIVETAALRTFQSRIPGAAWIETEACGHLPQKECPEQVLKALESLSIYGSF